MYGKRLSPAVYLLTMSGWEVGMATVDTVLKLFPAKSDEAAFVMDWTIRHAKDAAEYIPAYTSTTLRKVEKIATTLADDPNVTDGLDERAFALQDKAGQTLDQLNRMYPKIGFRPSAA